MGRNRLLGANREWVTGTQLEVTEVRTMMANRWM